MTTEAEQQAQARLAFGVGLEEQKTEQLERPPGQLCLQEMERQFERTKNNQRLTLTSTPTETDPASSNRKTLHLLNSTFSIRLADKLNEAAMFSNWNLDLSHKNHSE